MKKKTSKVAKKTVAKSTKKVVAKVTKRVAKKSAPKKSKVQTTIAPKLKKEGALMGFWKFLFMSVIASLLLIAGWNHLVAQDTANAQTVTAVAGE